MCMSGMAGPVAAEAGGWWGNDPATRFGCTWTDVRAAAGADGWQVSNPPILSLTPLRHRWRCSTRRDGSAGSEIGTLDAI